MIYSPTAVKPAAYQTHFKLTHLNGQQGYCLTISDGPRLIDIQFHPVNHEYRIRKMFEPGPGIPWAKIKREGEAVYYGRLKQ